MHVHRREYRKVAKSVEKSTRTKLNAAQTSVFSGFPTRSNTRKLSTPNRTKKKQKTSNNLYFARGARCSCFLTCGPCSETFDGKAANSMAPRKSRNPRTEIADRFVSVTSDMPATTKNRIHAPIPVAMKKDSFFWRDQGILTPTENASRNCTACWRNPRRRCRIQISLRPRPFQCLVETYPSEHQNFRLASRLNSKANLRRLLRDTRHLR